MPQLARLDMWGASEAIRHSLSQRGPRADPWARNSSPFVLVIVLLGMVDETRQGAGIRYDSMDARQQVRRERHQAVTHPRIS